MPVFTQSDVLCSLSLLVDRGQVVCLLGRNGAGKTTTLLSIIGLAPPRSGSIKFKGKEIAGRPTHIIAQMGMGFVPQDRRIFPDLTVRQNLEIAVKSSSSGEKWWTVDRVYGLFSVLRALDRRTGGNLSGGEAQMLSIARTLMGNPDMLLLDEPVEGIAPLIVATLRDQIQRLKEERVTILLSEQNLKFALGLSDRAYVIDKGVIRFKGTIAELKENEEVRQKYLAL